MPYDFKYAMSATVSPQVVEEMITRIVEEQTGKKVKSIKIELRTKPTGFGMTETIEPVFNGYTVNFEAE